MFEDLYEERRRKERAQLEQENINLAAALGVNLPKQNVVADLAAKRHENVMKDPAVAGKAPGGYEQVQLIACGACGGHKFQLAHDHRVICDTCRIFIEPMRWVDVTDQPPPGANDGREAG